MAFPRRPLLILPVALLLAAAPLRADEPRAAAPLTSYEAGPLKQANLVVLGRTASVRTQRQQQIASVDVTRVLLGEPPSRPLTVMVRGPHPSADLRNPDATTFPPAGSAPHVFFLQRRKGGVACVFRDAFEAQGALGEAKVSALREEIRLANISDPEQRTRETRAYLVAGLAAKGPWTRAHATHELLRFARARRDLIGEELESRLRARLRGRLPRAERAALETLVEYLQATPGGPTHEPGAPSPDAAPVHGRTADPDDPWRAAFSKANQARRSSMIEELLVAPRSADVKRAWWALGEAEAPVRRLIVRRVTDLRQGAHLERLLDAYAGEEEPSVREEVVRAVGLLGSDAHVAWLSARAENPVLERASLLALARIRTDGALRALRAARRRIAESDAAGVGRRLRWIDYLLSEKFEGSALMR